MISMNIKNLFNKNVITVNSDTKLKDALKTMIRNNYHQLPVVNDKYDGMINLKNIALSDINVETTKVSKFVIKVPTISPDEDVKEAAEKLLNSGFRALPVMSDGNLIGILSESDLIKAINKINIEEIINRSVLTVTKDCTIGKAKKILRDENISRLPVVDENGKVVGIVSDIDMAKILLKPEDHRLTTEKIPRLELAVTTIMSNEECIEFGTSFEKIKEHMKNFDECIFVKDNKPEGIITARDIIEKLVPVKKITNINFIKFDSVDDFEMEKINEILERFTQKISKMYDIQSIFLHLKTYEIKGNRKKYSLRARVYTNKGLFIAKSSEWSILASIQDIIEKLERIMKKKHEMEI